MGQGSEFQDNDSPSQDGGSPFSADLKGDFSSNFGTNTNAVSQIFKEGGFVGENKTRLMVLVGALVLVVAGALFYLSTGDSYDEEDFVVADEMEDDELLEDEDLAEEKAPPKKEAAEEPDLPVAEPDIPAPVAEDPLPSPADNLPSYESESMAGGVGSGGDSWPAATVAPKILGPSDGFQRTYDETTSPPAFSWEGSPGGWVVLSGSPDMNPVKFKRKASGNSLQIRKLMPGTWYWQVRNGAGMSAIRSFTIAEPVQRQLSLSAPADGGSVAGTGGVVTWTGDQKVSFYRIELSGDGSWANPTYRFATSGTQLQVRNVTAGSYQLRLGAFSEVSGRWEYTPPIGVTIQ